MFWPNWPSSGVQVVMVKDFAAHCNAVFFTPIVFVSGYFGYVGYHQFYLGVLGLHVVAFGFVWFVRCSCLECFCWGKNSHSSKNIQGSHYEQTKQNHNQVQCSDMARTVIMLSTGW
jgi:hypothetical protein